MSAYGILPAGPAPAGIKTAGMKPERGASDDAGFTLSDLVAVVRARRRLVAGVAVAVVVLTTAVLLVLPTMYSATAVVMLEQRKNNVADAAAVLSDLPTDTASLQNQIQILTSRDLAGEVVDSLNLEEDPEFNPARSTGAAATLARIARSLDPRKWFASSKPPDMIAAAAAAAAERSRVVGDVLHNLSVDTVGLSSSISVRFDADSAQKSARIANAFANTYVARQVAMKSQASDQATQWLAARADQLGDQVQAADTAVEKYKAAHDLNETANGGSLVDQQLAAINSQLVQARADLTAKQATYDRVQDLIASGEVANASQVVSSPLIVQLRTQEAQLLQQQADMATRYGPKHPKIIAVQSQIRDLENKLTQEVNRIAGSLGNDVAVAQAQVDSLQASLKNTEREANRQNAATVKLKALQADATSTREMYQTFVTRLRQTQDQGAIQMPDAQVISPAPVPSLPSSPHRTLIFAASIPAGLLLGLMAALMAERFVPGVRVEVFHRPANFAAPRPAPPRARPPEPPRLLARIPGAASVRAIDQVIDWPYSDFALGINKLMGAIASPAQGARARVVAVTALAAEESKTAVVLGLARTAARAGWRVVVVDGDLARAPAARTLGYQKSPNGLVEAMNGKAPLSHCFLKDPRSGVLTLSSLAPVGNSAGLLSSPVMARLFAHLRRASDLVIVDATPLGMIGDTRALVRYADAVLLVADPRRNSAHAIRAAGHALAAMQSPPVGIVLTA